MLAAELGGRDLGELVRVGEATALGALLDQAGARIAEQAGKEYGIEVVDVRLRRLNYPEEVRSAVFEQIRSERRRVAAATRAEGESQARRIRSAADRERAHAIAEAEADAARLIGEGEAQATRIANEAHAADPAFYRFLKTLETYRAALDRKTMLVLSSESEFLRLLTRGIPAVAGSRRRRPPSPVGRRRSRSGRARRPGEDRHEAMDRAGDRGRAARLPGDGAGGRLAGRVGRRPSLRRASWPSRGAPGLHWGLPWGIDRVDRVKTGQTRTLAVGARGRRPRRCRGARTREATTS